MDPWVNTILGGGKPADVWAGLFADLGTLAKTETSPVKLQTATLVPDRLLSESAWELWNLYSDAAPRTSSALIDWCQPEPGQGKAVLVLDALSLRELHLILGGADQNNIKPVSVRVTGSEIPSDTNTFAHALGIPQRSSLVNNKAPSGFKPFNRQVYTDYLDVPFADSALAVTHDPNVFIWHGWLDNLLHTHTNRPDQVVKEATRILQSDDFWKFINRLRQGRRLVITSDHGYAVSKDYTNEADMQTVAALRETFKAMRLAEQPGEFVRLMPPMVMRKDAFLVIMGQKKWKVPGGFPFLCHGGLSLLEVAVPFVELPPL